MIDAVNAAATATPDTEAEDIALAASIDAGKVPDEQVMDIAEAFDVIGIDPESMTAGTIALGNAAWAARDRILGPVAANDDVPPALFV